MNGGFVVIFALFVSFLIISRWLQHKETMELARQGIIRPDSSQRYTKRARAGLIVAGVGAAITLGMLPMVLSVGPESSPALIGGLVPLAVGLALMYTGREPEQLDETTIDDARRQRKLSAGSDDYMIRADGVRIDEPAKRPGKPDPHQWLE